MTVWRMRITYWVTNARDTHSEYLILTAFPRQQWFPEGTSVLRLHVHCPSCYHHHRFYYLISKLIIIIIAIF